MSSRIRIFVVDDEQDLTDLLHYQLGKEGFKVKFSNNPYEALGNARDFNPDLIILDVMMPDLNGFQLFLTHSVCKIRKATCNPVKGIGSFCMSSYIS